MAKPPQADSGPSSSRRAQPVRQTRVNPPRTSAGVGRAAGARESLGSGQRHDQPIDIFPATTHFTDAIASLPTELARHFTLLKEVDAKIFAPEENLFQLVDAALRSRPPEPRSANDASSSIAPASTPMSTQNSTNGLPLSGHPAPGSTDDNYNTAVFDPSNVPRRQLFRQTAYKIQEMLVSLEEKNHVISTANEALSKQNSRINDVWPHLENEFSDEAKWGSTTHWAYPENRANRAMQAERSRRDGAANLTAAAQQIAEEAAARSDARKQAVLARKGQKNQHQDSDMDDHENKQKGETTKRPHGAGKARKAADAAAAAVAAAATAAPVGLGITPGPAPNGNPPSKRRKVENNKSTNGAQPMERAMSSVFGNTTTKTTKNSSPRATPAPEPTKKRKALPTTNGISKKSKTVLAAAAASPSIASSPIPPNSNEPKTIGRASPAPAAANPRPASSRARQNSIQSTAENGRQRPTSAASNRPNGVAAATPEPSSGTNGSRLVNETKVPKEPTIKTELSKDDANPPVPTTSVITASHKKDNPMKGSDLDLRGDPTQDRPIMATTIVTTKSGRASKPSTPALGSFPDPPPQRSRASRNTTATGAKRSHKKGASQHAIPARITDEDATSSGHDGDGDADEPRYCYCNGVSYGEMVACDADDCPREWFHLGCVGLKAAPPQTMKWYCDKCKDRVKNGKKVNGR
ncbi:hypothetical protein F4778DRAFT_742549 [Xylariomycetidae sp. FL2044]|nr:hypothetical protein F4778DRAFT_742549 [Xylariomycetidae sp. FL2044]